MPTATGKDRVYTGTDSYFLNAASRLQQSHWMCSKNGFGIGAPAHYLAQT